VRRRSLWTTLLVCVALAVMAGYAVHVICLRAPIVAQDVTR
jgi:hypothetical protein